MEHGRVPIDGGLFQMDEYLKAVSSIGDGQFYKLYDLHLKYFCSLYKMIGSKDFLRIWPVIIRTAYEFGKVAVGKVNGRWIVVNVATVEYSFDYTIKYITGTPARFGYGIQKNQKLYRFDGDKIVFLKTNFNAFPFIYYWKDHIQDYITLRQTALTASIASMKKFKKNVNNNSSAIADIEMASMLDPKSPAIQVISQPVSYKQELINKVYGNVRNADITNSTTPNSISFESSNSDATPQWENLKSFLEQDYYLLGRRINTNKKAERNIAREIDTETINFDILEQDFLNYLEQFVEELNEKFGENVEIENLALVIDKDEEGEIKDEQDTTKSGKNNTKEL